MAVVNNPRIEEAVKDKMAAEWNLLAEAVMRTSEKVEWLIEQQRPHCSMCGGHGVKTEYAGRVSAANPLVTCPFCGGTGCDPNWVPDMPKP